MNIHVIAGKDGLVVDEAARRVAGSGPVEIIDSLESTNAESQSADIAKAEESLLTPPFLDPEKTTWWKNVHFLPGGKGKVSEEVKTALERFAKTLASANLPENQRFVITGPHLLKSSVFAKTLAGVAEIAVFAEETPWAAARSAAARAIDEAQEQGFKFEPGAAEKFVATVGTDARSIRNEVAKLRDYLEPGAGIATAADVAEISSPGANVEPLLWNLTDAIGERRPAAAMAALRSFEGGTNFAVFICSVLEKFFRQLYDLSRGAEPDMTPNARRKAEVFLKRWSRNELRRARARFMLLREKAVSGTASGDVLVATALLREMRGAR